MFFVKRKKESNEYLKMDEVEINEFEVEEFKLKFKELI